LDICPKAVSELSRCGTPGACIGRVHDFLESTLDGRLIGLFDLVGALLILWVQQRWTVMPG
jgi:hypothetical protein